MAAQKAENGAPSIGDLAYASYVSLGVSAHRPLTDAAAASFGAAYRWHLRGWLPKERGAWLDVACGQGALLLLAKAEGFARVEGVDLSDEMLDSCRRLGLPTTREDARVFLARTTPRSWNVVSLFDVVEHFTKTEALEVLQSVRAALAPGGACFVKVPNAASPWGPGVMAADLTHATSFTSESLASLARLAGFTSIDVREVGPAPSTWKGRVRRALWQGLRAGYAVANVIETGSPGDGVYTRVLLARLTP
jgi:SAM-dependent methyltransferase